MGGFEGSSVGVRGWGVGEELGPRGVDFKHVWEAAWRGPGEETGKGLRFHFCGWGIDIVIRILCIVRI